jgi:hypothetical protein
MFSAPASSMTIRSMPGVLRPTGAEGREATAEECVDA